MWLIKRRKPYEDGRVDVDSLTPCRLYFETFTKPKAKMKRKSETCGYELFHYYMYHIDLLTVNMQVSETDEKASSC
jgi:hypothetical protein